MKHSPERYAGKRYRAPIPVRLARYHHLVIEYLNELSGWSTSETLRRGLEVLLLNHPGFAPEVLEKKVQQALEDADPDTRKDLEYQLKHTLEVFRANIIRHQFCKLTFI